MSTKAALKIDWCTAEAARYAVENWHYSKQYPVSKNIKIGAWEGGQFVGAIMFATGANYQIGAPFGLKQTEICELVRVALRSHQTQVSRIMSIAMAFLRKHCPGTRAIISYADPVQGHHGGIYQAGNWIYLGMTSASFEYRHDGKRLQKRAYTGLNFGETFRRAPPAGTVKVPVPGKHKYFYPLDDAMRAQIAPLAKPYPKRPVDSKA